MLNLSEDEAEAGHHQMVHGHVFDALLQCVLAAHRVTGGDRRQNCSLVSEAPAFGVWAIRVEMSRAEGDVRRANASQLDRGLQQPSQKPEVLPHQDASAMDGCELAVEALQKAGRNLLLQDASW